MSRRRPVSEDEALLFRRAMTGATPLTARAKKPPPVPPKPPKPPPKPLPMPPPAPALPPPRPKAHLPALAHGAAPGVDKRTLERFKKGEMTVEAQLDLHGMTQEAAHAALARFVERAAAAGLRTLLVVTGKGGREGTGVLRAQVPRWLNEAGLRPHLLAIHRARPQHGGDGALYVLLKRKR